MTSARTARPVLAVTLGDVAGIGPEIVAKTLLQHPDLREKCVPVVVGDADAMRAGAVRAGLEPDTVTVITDPRGTTNDPGTIELIQTGPSLADVPVGELSAAAGDGAYRFVVEACRLAREGNVDAIVTPPLNKAAMHAGGHDWPGHTELLAHELDVRNFSLVLSAGDLYVFHLTGHVSLQQAVENCTADRVDDVFTLAHAFVGALGKPDEAIAVAGLNPHAGENRIFGDEDADVLAPAVARARERGRQRARPDPRGRPDPGRGPGQVEHRRRLLPRPGPRAVQGGLRRRRRQHHHRPARGPGLGRPRRRVRHRRQGHRARGEPRAVLRARRRAGSGLGRRVAGRLEQRSDRSGHDASPPRSARGGRPAPNQRRLMTNPTADLSAFPSVRVVPGAPRWLRSSTSPGGARGSAGATTRR